MGLIDDLNRTKQEKNGLLASLDKAKAEQPNRPLSTTVKDIGVSVGAGVPNVLGTLADVVDMATGDSIDVVGQFGDAAKGVGQQILNEGLSPETLSERQAISQTLSDENAGIGDMAMSMFKNPMGALTMGAESAATMLVPSGAGVGLAKAAPTIGKLVPRVANALTPVRAGAIGATGANALLNAGDTFGELEGQSLTDRYLGASVPLVASSVLGPGVDSQVVQRFLGEAATPIVNTLKDAFKNFGKGALKGGAKEFVSEAGEGGSQAVGEAIGKGEEINPTQVGKQAFLEGALGAAPGTVGGGLSNVKMAEPKNEPLEQIEQTVAKLVEDAQANQTQPEDVVANVLKALGGLDDKYQESKPHEEVAPEPVAEQTEQTPVAEEPQAQTEVRRIDRGILQNRKRDDKDSVNQMRKIANAPDYGRVGYSRDFANGAPVVAFGSIPEEQKGRTDYAVSVTGERIPVQYAVVDADTVSTSNDINGAENPDYGLTDRVTAIAGNGRMTALGQAYRQGSAQAYRQEMTEDTMHGVNPQVIAKMKNPVLVRIMPNERVRDDIGDMSNISSNKSLSAIETARNDANRVDLDSLEFNEDGTPTRDSLSRFVSGMPDTERGSMMDKEGRATVQAVDRLNNAIFAKAYNNDDITAMYAEATDPEAKLVVNALARLAPKMAKLEGCGELDFRNALVDAVNAIVQGKRKGLKMQDILAQQDFLADPDVALFVELFARNPRSNKDVVAILSEAADFAYNEATKSDEDMFGEVQKASRGDVMNYVRDEFNKVKEAKNGKQAKQQANVQDASGGIGASQNVDGRDAGANPQSNERAGLANAQADESFSLSGQTEQEIIADEKAEEERQAQAEREEAEAEKQEEANNLRKEIDQRNEDYANDFTLEDDTVTGEDALRGQKPLFSRKGEIKDPLVTLHNITENGLMKAARLGGLPAPSLAVSKVESPLQQFGEITLVGTKDLADPTKNPVFSVDAYTARFPKLDWSKSLKKAEGRELAREIDSAYSQVSNGTYESSVNYYLRNHPNRDEAIDKLAHSSAGMAMFLNHKGIKFKPVYQKAVRKNGVNDATIAAFKKIRGDISDESNRRIFGDALRAWLVEAAQKPGLGGRFVTRYARAFIEDPGYKTQDVIDLIEGYYDEVRRYLDTVKQHKEFGAPIDEYATKDALKAKIKRYQSEYEKFIADKVNAAFDAPRIEDGNKSAALTLENVVRAMTRGPVRGAEGGMAENTFGAIRAKASKQYATMEEMQADRSRVVDRDASYESEKEVDAKFDAFTSAIYQYWKYPESSYSFEKFEAAREVLAKAAANPTAASLKRALKSEGFENVDDETIEIGVDALKSAAKVLTDYLEVKPQRAVAFNEFAGAVVPNTISDEARSFLEGEGLEIQTYNPKLEGGRVRATQRLINRLNRERGDIKFSRNQEDGSTVEDVTASLESDKDIGEAFAMLRDSGEVDVVQSIEDLPEEIRSQIDDANKSKRNTLTGNVVNDSAVTPENDIGYVGTVNFKNVKHDFPSGDVVVRPGHHREPHSGMGAKHLTANVLKETARDRYPDLENKTESGLRGVRDVLRTATTMYRVDESRRDVHYVFYSPKLRQAVVTAYKYEKGVFEVITNTPVSNPQDRWGADFVSLSGALAIPENEASASSPSSSSTSDGNAEGLRLPKALKGKYIDVDYTEEMRGALQIKRSDNGDIQGLYDPRTGKAYLIADALTDETAKPVFLHELGVHSAYGKNPLKLESQMKLARNMVNNGYAQGNEIAVRVKQRLFDANEIDSMDAPIPMEAAEECLSYLVEETASTDDRGPFRKWFDSLMNAIKQWLRNHGINVNLNEWDFVEIAKGNVVAMAKQSGKEMGLSYSKKGGKKPKQPSKQPKQQDGRFLERDELGRFRLKAGRKLIEGLGYTVAAADSLLANGYKMQNAPQALRIQIRDMKAKIKKAGMDATEMANLMKEMKEAERKLISDVVEQELAPGVNPPAHVMQIATKITQIMDAQAQELVSLGMLSQSSYDRYRGKYLPRFYLKAKDDEGVNFFAKIFGARARMRGVAGSHLKGRGIFKEVPLDEAQDYVDLGWEVRDPNYEYVDGNVQLRQGVEDEPGMVVVWRDFTKKEREDMGEIRDASYRFAVGYLETQRDLAIGRLFKAIASNPEWTSNTARDGFIYIPRNEVPDAGGVLKYGALAGKYVDETVLSHISHIEDVPDGVVRAFRQGMAFWKEGKTAMNPVSHMNNTVGNFIAAHLGGIDMWDVKAYAKALRSLRTADASFKEAQDTGLFTGSFSQEEFVKSLPEDLRHLAEQEETGFKKFGDLMMKIFTWGLRDKLRKAYEFEDAFFKMAIYQKAREAGLDPQHAVDYAHKFVFVYDTLPEGARKLRNSLFPFFAWTYQAVPMLATAAVCYPWRFFAPAAILFALNKAFFLAAAGDDDDTWAERWKKASQLEDAERTLLPKYMQGSTLFMTPKFLRLGIDEATGLPQYINLSHMVPGGNFLDFENQMGGVPLPEILTPNHPLLNAFMAYIGNQDMFSGFDMTKETDSTGEKVQKYAEYTWKQLTPAIAIGNYHWGRLMDGVAGATGVTMPIDRTGVNRHGEVMPLDVAIKNMVGLKVRTFDPDNEMNRQMRGHAYNQRMIQSEKRSAYRRARAGALPIDSYQEFAKKSDEKVRKVREEMGEVRKARATIKDLSGK